MKAKPFTHPIESWKYPKDASKIAPLSISDFQYWYALQDPKEMVFLGQNREFKRFIWKNYTWKVKLLRLYYRIKNICLNLRKGYQVIEQDGQKD